MKTNKLTRDYFNEVFNKYEAIAKIEHATRAIKKYAKYPDTILIECYEIEKALKELNERK